MAQFFKSIPRWSREVTITEKIDGTNAGVLISSDPLLDEERLTYRNDMYVYATSKKRFITPEDDNFGFASWVYHNSDELVNLGEGHHFGEWWGHGIQRGYGQKTRYFSLFNTSRWSDPQVRPECCEVVPVLWEGNMDDISKGIHETMEVILKNGSVVAPEYDRPEGIIIFHHASNQLFKKTYEHDETGKPII